MTPTERMKAIQDAVDWLDDLHEATDCDTKDKANLWLAIGALAPIISGELVIVPAEPTVAMLGAASRAIAMNWPTRDVLRRAFKAYQEQE